MVDGESGVPYEGISWSGVFVPALTPPAIVNKRGAELRSILKLPDVQERLASDGNDFGANTSQSLAAFIKSETAKYQIAVKISGSKLE
jgi:tripartite-type tricarboxylate transporter receptor subunit TctC